MNDKNDKQVIFESENSEASIDMNPKPEPDHVVATPNSESTENQENTGILNKPVKKLIKIYVDSMTSEGEHTPIHVDEIASKIAKFYELIRKIVDWKEDNMLRRGAIERILKRVWMSKISGIDVTNKIDTYKVASTVTHELIRGGHLPNDEIPKENIKIVEKTLTKYLYFLSNNTAGADDLLIIKKKINYSTFLIELAACEIEEILTDPVKEYELINAMTDTISERINIIPKNGMNDDQKKTHVFIAVCKALYDLDEPYITYRLIKRWTPNWSNLSESQLKEVNTRLTSLINNVNKFVEHPTQKYFNDICDRTDTAFTLVGDFLEEYKNEPSKIMSGIKDKEKFKEKIANFYDKRFTTLKTRLIRFAFFATLSVFLSNIVTFFIVEVPMAKIFAEGFNFFTAAVDFVVPTIAMFALVSIIRPPPERNKKKAIDLVFSFVYNDQKKKLYEVYLTKRRRYIFVMAFSLLYVIFAFIFFGGIGALFLFAGLPISSVLFDTLTIALNVFAAVLIRKKSKELTVDERTSVHEFLLDMITLPVAKVGSFFANKWKEYNIVAVFFTFMIETPFVIIVQVIERWSEFLRDRKTELQ